MFTGLFREVGRVRGYDFPMATTAESRVFGTNTSAYELQPGPTVTEQVPIEMPPNACNLRYLQTKRAKFEADEQ